MVQIFFWKSAIILGKPPPDVWVWHCFWMTIVFGAKFSKFEAKLVQNQNIVCIWQTWLRHDVVLQIRLKKDPFVTFSRIYFQKWLLGVVYIVEMGHANFTNCFWAYYTLLSVFEIKICRWRWRKGLQNEFILFFALGFSALLAQINIVISEFLGKQAGWSSKIVS